MQNIRSASEELISSEPLLLGGLRLTRQCLSQSWMDYSTEGHSMILRVRLLVALLGCCAFEASSRRAVMLLKQRRGRQSMNSPVDGSMVSWWRCLRRWIIVILQLKDKLSKILIYSEGWHAPKLSAVISLSLNLFSALLTPYLIQGFESKFVNSSKRLLLIANSNPIPSPCFYCSSQGLMMTLNLKPLMAPLTQHRWSFQARAEEILK